MAINPHFGQNNQGFQVGINYGIISNEFHFSRGRVLPRSGIAYNQVTT